MNTVERASNDLDLLGRQVWNITLDDLAVVILTQKLSRLSAQLAVQHVLQDTVRHLIKQQSIIGIPNSQIRVSRFIENAYGELDYATKPNELRWERLRGLDCEPFLLLALSYTPLDISKMNRIEFDYLVENAARFLQVKALSPRWLFHVDIQLIIAGKVGLQGAAEFRKRYHALEFASDNSQGGEPTFGNPLEQPSLNHPRMTDQPTDSDQERGDVEQYQISGVAERPEKRRRVAITSQGQEASPSGSVYQVILLQPSPNTSQAQDEQARPEAANSLSPSNENREMKYMFTNAPASNISRLPEPFRSAVESSQLWKWERSRGLLTTGCWPSLFPKDHTQDVSFTIWCGHDDGYRLIQFFGSELAISS